MKFYQHPRHGFILIQFDENNFVLCQLACTREADQPDGSGNPGLMFEHFDKFEDAWNGPEATEGRVLSSELLEKLVEFVKTEFAGN